MAAESITQSDVDRIMKMISASGTSSVEVTVSPLDDIDLMSAATKWISELSQRLTKQHRKISRLEAENAEVAKLRRELKSAQDEVKTLKSQLGPMSKKDNVIKAFDDSMISHIISGRVPAFADIDSRPALFTPNGTLDSKDFTPIAQDF